MKIVAIDPGDVVSALVVYDDDARVVQKRDIWENALIEQYLRHFSLISEGSLKAHCAIEMVESFGMPVGRTVFETVYWIGRFASAWDTPAYGRRCCERIYRGHVKMHMCNNRAAKDANIRQSVMDRFGSTREAAIGNKKNPGPLYGIKKDLWQALALALTFSETYTNEPCNRSDLPHLRSVLV